MSEIDEVFVFDDASPDDTLAVGRAIQREELHEGKRSVYRN
jgi:hypothetical protein